MLKEQRAAVPDPGHQGTQLIHISSLCSQDMEEGRRKGYEVTQRLKDKARESGSGRKVESKMAQSGSGVDTCDWSLTPQLLPKNNLPIPYIVLKTLSSGGDIQLTTLDPVPSSAWV